MISVKIEIVKKLERVRQPASGLLLSSVSECDAGFRAVVTGDGLDEVKKLCSSMRSEGYGILHRSRGKSLEVTAQRGVLCEAAGAMVSFLSRLELASDEATDMVAFLSAPSDVPCAELSLESLSCDRDSMSARFLARPCDGADAQQLYAQLAPVLDKYGLGIIKEE